MKKHKDEAEISFVNLDVDLDGLDFVDETDVDRVFAKPVIPNIDAEKASSEEAKEIETAFLRSKSREDERYADAMDGEFFLALIFQSKCQRDEFVQKVGWGHLLDDTFIDGIKLARHLDVTLETESFHVPKFKIDKDYAKLAG